MEADDLVTEEPGHLQGIDLVWPEYSGLRSNICVNFVG